MGGPEDGLALAPGHLAPEERPDPVGGLGIERPRRLVDEQDGRVGEQGPGEGEHLPHARRIAVEAEVGRLVESRQPQELAHPAVPVPAPQAVQGGEELEVLPPGQAPVEAPLVADGVADGGLGPARLAGDVMALDQGPPPVRQDERRQDLEERRLARSVGPEEAEDAAAADLEVEPVERGHGAPVEGPQGELPEAADDGIPLDQAFDEEGGRSAHFGSRSRRAAVRAGLKSLSAYRP